ncbi:NAD(P)H-dependent glycerol-3-phosphate dehydrogenase [Streptomyces sp. SCL15-4]|uniref:NAD(P)H-dependent glycerol-3-phosphate dehydrogenase n=1 Tax=Streptomyces sp. SCL15-4 TaxID=2967221 RepID=UPI00296655F9|nr:NAD(P)H-dependent glycerol-3-phosphate dehydrogenase [Streptomyces sp. SCL15-4]
MAQPRIAVMGAGSWGTAFSVVLADAGCDVTLWARRPDIVQAVNDTRGNPEYMPGVRLLAAVRAEHDPARALAGADVTVLAVSSQSVRLLLADWARHLAPGTVLVSLMKGMEQSTGMLMSQVIAEVTGASSDRVAVVSGPNLAREVALRQPAATVIACADEPTAATLQGVCRTPYFRPYTSTDVIGVEIGGVVKNVIAVAAGIADGMGLGDNTKSALITRGLTEAMQLAAVMGADPRTLSGLAGMGDLVATCTSTASRNHSLGYWLGRGLPLREAQAHITQTAEGVFSCTAVQALGQRYAVQMPIAETVAGIIHDGRNPREALAALLSRPVKCETAGGPGPAVKDVR